MEKNIGIALLGAGDRGKLYCGAFKKIDGTRFVSVFDPQADRTANAVTEYGFTTPCTDFQSAVNAPGVTVVVIASPAYFHPEEAIYAMERGKHVICEKPMALSLASANEMIATAKKHNVVLTIGLQYRNIHGYRKFKRAIENGSIGRPVLARFSDVREMRPKRAMHDAQNGNGGPLVDMSCHFLDLMRWYFDSDPVRVSCRNFAFAADRPELAHIAYKAPDTGVMVVEFASGDIGEISVCWGLPPQVNGELKYDALGPLGMLVFKDDKVTRTTEGNVVEEVALDDADTAITQDAELSVVREFLGAIEGKGAPSTGGNEAAVALATSLAALRSAAQGRPVTIAEIITDAPSVVGAMSAVE